MYLIVVYGQLQGSPLAVCACNAGVVLGSLCMFGTTTHASAKFCDFFQGSVRPLPLDLRFCVLLACTIVKKKGLSGPSLRGPSLGVVGGGGLV